MIYRSIQRIRHMYAALQEVGRLPEPTFDMVRLAAAWFARLPAAGTLVQVGACDGLSGDPLHHLIAGGSIKAILLEPVPATCVRLRETYANLSGVTVVQAAVADRDGVATLFKVKDGPTSIDPFWAVQLASFDRGHLMKHGVDPSDIEAVSVPSVTLETLISTYDIDRIGFLQIDTEGYDAEIVRLALQLPSPPAYINFEHIHLKGGGELNALFEQLRLQEYAWVHDKWNTLAVHRSAAAGMT